MLYLIFWNVLIQQIYAISENPLCQSYSPCTNNHCKYNPGHKCYLVKDFHYCCRIYTNGSAGESKTTTARAILAMMETKETEVECADKMEKCPTTANDCILLDKDPMEFCSKSCGFCKSETTTEKSPEKDTTTNSKTSEKIGENQATTVSNCKDEIEHCPTDPIGCMEAGIEAMNSCRKSCEICHIDPFDTTDYPEVNPDDRQTSEATTAVPTTKKPQPPTVTKPKPTRAPRPCRDFIQNCPKDYAVCSRYKLILENNCAYSCKFCGYTFTYENRDKEYGKYSDEMMEKILKSKNPNCRDKISGCHQLFLRGLCFSHVSIQSRLGCQKTCGLC